MNLGNVLNQTAEILERLPLSGESPRVDHGFMGTMSSLLSKYTRNGLTGAEQEMNAFNAQQARIAFEREMYADATKHQRNVADLQAAGLNPMLAVGQSGGSVSASPASGSAAPGASIFGNLFSLFLGLKQLGIQKQLATAEIANKAADTAKKQSETSGIDIANSIAGATQAAQIEAASLRNSLTRAQYNVANKQLDQIEATVRKLSEEAKTEEDKRMYYEASAILSKMNAYNISEMLPYNKALATAKTASERQAASLSAVSAAYKQGLIDNGYIEAFAREMAASAGIAENDERMSDIKTALRTGDYSKTEAIGSLKGDFSSRLLQSLTIALDNLNPLNSIFK